MKDEEIASKADITPVHNEKQQRLVEIKFECFVTGYDSTTREVEKMGLTYTEFNPLKPQWFKLSFRFTLEGIKAATESELGRVLKARVAELERHIDRYYK